MRPNICPNTAVTARTFFMFAPRLSGLRTLRSAMTLKHPNHDGKTVRQEGEADRRIQESVFLYINF